MMMGLSRMHIDGLFQRVVRENPALGPAASEAHRSFHKWLESIGGLDAAQLRVVEDGGGGMFYGSLLSVDRVSFNERRGSFAVMMHGLNGMTARDAHIFATELIKASKVPFNFDTWRLMSAEQMAAVTSPLHADVMKRIYTDPDYEPNLQHSLRMPLPPHRDLRRSCRATVETIRNFSTWVLTEVIVMDPSGHERSVALAAPLLGLGAGLVNHPALQNMQLSQNQLMQKMMQNLMSQYFKGPF